MKAAWLFFIVAVWLLGSTPARAADVEAASGGIARQYPADNGIGRHPNVIFAEAFEDDGWPSRFGYRGPAGSITVSGESGWAGRGARLHANSKRHYVDLRYAFGAKGKPEPEELYFRYRFRYDEKLLAMPGGKWLGFGGTYGRAGWGGRAVNGRDGWSARGCFHIYGKGIRIGYYCYHADMKGRYGNTWNWPDLLLPDRWYTVECYVKLNTPGAGGGRGQNDGILRGWLDGRRVFEKTGIRFRDVNKLKIETVWLNFGTGKAPADGITLDIDNVVIAGSYIGPVAERTEAPKTEAPKPVDVAGEKSRTENRKAAKLYRSARDAERRGMKPIARMLYERLVKEYPDSQLAEEAKQRLGSGS